MHRALSGLIVCAGFVAAASAQGPAVPPSTTPPQPATTTREAKVPLTVQGCVYDTRLQIAPIGINGPARTLGGGDEFVLEGPKELMRQLKTYHYGHEEQISGIVTIPPRDDRDTLTSTKRVGSKTTITAGGSQQPKPDAKKPDNGTKHFLRLKVEEVRHVQDKCQYAF
jgi:hypothetical protein